MRIGAPTRFGWAGLVTDESRVFFVCGISVLEIDWERSRVLHAALQAKTRRRTPREEAWRAHFQAHGVLGGLRKWSTGRRLASEYMRHQSGVREWSSMPYRMTTDEGWGDVMPFFGGPPHVPVMPPHAPQPPMRRAH